jgi:(2Fe-2S) ferredoxin
MELPGTVKFYERHLFVCTGHSDWPARIELDGGFLQSLAEAVALHEPEMAQKVKITACDTPGLTATGYDLLIFPDQVRYIGLQTADLAALVEDHLIGNRISPSLHHQPLFGRHLFICVHGRRDERCGQCGPPLAAAFQAALAGRPELSDVVVYQTSHVGGHAYAGNVLIYPGGDWYGYVTPQDVPRLLESHLLNNEIVIDLWRGRMAMTPEAQIAAVNAIQ